MIGEIEIYRVSDVRPLMVHRVSWELCVVGKSKGIMEVSMVAPNTPQEVP